MIHDGVYGVWPFEFVSFYLKEVIKEYCYHHLQKQAEIHLESLAIASFLKGVDSNQFLMCIYHFSITQYIFTVLFQRRARANTHKHAHACTQARARTHTHKHTNNMYKD